MTIDERRVVATATDLDGLITVLRPDDVDERVIREWFAHLRDPAAQAEFDEAVQEHNDLVTGFATTAPPRPLAARPADLVVLLGRAAELLRRRAGRVAYPPADYKAVHWFPDAQIDVLACVALEGTEQVVAGDLHPDLAAYFATWDPATAAAAAAVLEHAARCVRLGDSAVDHHYEIALARQIMRRAGDAP